jgi:hypothetical protein
MATTLALAGALGAGGGCGGSSVLPEDARPAEIDATAAASDAAVPADAAAAAAGSWEDPIAIAALPFLAVGDGRTTRSRADSYDCASRLDASGGEVVYRLVLDSATTIRLGVDDAAPISDCARTVWSERQDRRGHEARRGGRCCVLVPAESGARNLPGPTLQ